MTLPSLQCKMLCQDSCGIVPMRAREIAELQKASGLTFSVRPFMADSFLIVPPGEDICPALGEHGGCLGYEGRPMICRLFGLVEKMRCPHGCEPERWLTDQEAKEFLDRC